MCSGLHVLPPAILGADESTLLLRSLVYVWSLCLNWIFSINIETCSCLFHLKYEPSLYFSCPSFPVTVSVAMNKNGIGVTKLKGRFPALSSLGLSALLNPLHHGPQETLSYSGCVRHRALGLLRHRAPGVLRHRALGFFLPMWSHLRFL